MKGVMIHSDTSFNNSAIFGAVSGALIASGIAAPCSSNEINKTSEETQQNHDNG